MPVVTIRDLSEETHRAIEAQAARHGRSAEAEIRAILETAVRHAPPVRLGSLLASIAAEAGLSEEDAESFNRLRDKTPAEPLDFG
ncbi:hypothetical protein BJF92_23280 [Rhizobium rhizosphaerae]|uniref:Antitoxin FitA-like ribbon-helix-helix domain-containing protein n=1 Tax=Xaviernesmea rhizosphaerae TaxID=1672749 RepID=A0A1Q9AJP1_9HYPH|nr:hypothetical protein [Xaviernesmea rhizosphaerae]OLP55465.1 hypothetical protein BJF92_23280 [Xaviernesmea rhizosphaerae]OQP85566.1 hypothetical protein BTR14_15380 [Xaviernesmea rhizosphaerae]